MRREEHPVGGIEILAMRIHGSLGAYGCGRCFRVTVVLEYYNNFDRSESCSRPHTLLPDIFDVDRCLFSFVRTRTRTRQTMAYYH